VKGYRLHRCLAIFFNAGALLLLTGCQGLAGGSNAAGTIGLGSSSLNFGSVPVGTSKTLSDTITNSTSSAITIQLDSRIGIRLYDHWTHGAIDLGRGTKRFLQRSVPIYQCRRSDRHDFL
jgi:hypothetical protein